MAVALENRAGLKLVHVPFGRELAVTTVLGDKIEASVQLPAEIMTQVTGRQVRVLAITGDKRLASLRSSQELDELKEEIRDRFGPYGTVVENLFLVMNLRRTLKHLLVQQISASDGKVFLLFHPESPVKVEKLLDLIRKQKSRFRLSPDGRLSFAPRNLEWEPLMDEVTELLASIEDLPAVEKFQADSLPA